MPTNTPKECRAGRKCEPRSLKEALDCLFHHSRLSGPDMCERAGLDYNRMAKACSLYDERMPRLDEIRRLTIASADEPKDRNLVVYRFELASLNCALVTLPTAAVAGDEFFGAMTVATERLSHIGRELHESLRNDDIIDADELRKVKARTQAMHEQIAVVEAMAEARCAKPAPLRAVEGGR